MRCTSTVPSSPTFYHTLLQFTCISADEEKTDIGAIEKIWEAIKTLEITTADTKRPLFYYKSWKTNCLSTEALLRDEDGQCGAFSDFMLDGIQVQGIRHGTESKQAVSVFIKNNSIDADVMLVKNWSFTTSSFSTIGISQGIDPAYTFAGIPEQTLSISGNSHMEDFTANNNYNWQYSDFISFSGVSGQGINDEPRRNFFNHQFTNINGVFRDPNYGLVYDSVQGFENDELAGYMCSRTLTIDENEYDFDNDGVPDDLNNNNNNNNNSIEVNAKVIVYFLTTDKTLVDLGSNL